jgi:hypothetical protein
MGHAAVAMNSHFNPVLDADLIAPRMSTHLLHGSKLGAAELLSERPSRLRRRTRRVGFTTRREGSSLEAEAYRVVAMNPELLVSLARGTERLYSLLQRGLAPATRNSPPLRREPTAGGPYPWHARQSSGQHRLRSFRPALCRGTAE